jgi:uncharacterized membrane protein
MNNRDMPYVLVLIMFVLYLFSVIVDKLSGFGLLMNITGIPFVIFLPGYSVVLAFFNEKEWLEKIILGICLSMVAVPIIGLILNFTPFGINFVSTAFATGLFTLLFSVFAFLNRAKLKNDVI